MKRSILVLSLFLIITTLCGCGTAAPKEIIVAEKDISLLTGDYYALDYLVEPIDAYYELTFSSSDDSVVTVDDGILKAISSGKAIITVNTQNDISEEWKIKVSDPPATELLSRRERRFLRVFMSVIENFTVPNSVRITKISSISDDHYRITVQSQNRMGATLTGNYDIAFGSFKEAVTSVTSHNTSFDIGLINEAIKSYFE